MERHATNGRHGMRAIESAYEADIADLRHLLSSRVRQERFKVKQGGGWVDPVGPGPAENTIERIDLRQALRCDRRRGLPADGPARLRLDRKNGHSPIAVKPIMGGRAFRGRQEELTEGISFEHLVHDRLWMPEGEQITCRGAQV